MVHSALSCDASESELEYDDYLIFKNSHDKGEASKALPRFDGSLDRDVRQLQGVLMHSSFE